MLLSSGGVSAGAVALTGDRSVESSLWCESSGARQNGPSPALQAPFPVDSQASCLGGRTSPPLQSPDLWENLHWLVIDSTLPAPLPEAPVKLAASWGRQSTEGVRGREQRPSDPPLQLTLI